MTLARRPLHRSLLTSLPFAVAVAALGLIALPSEAEAGVRASNNRGIEIEGAMDRRGVYIGPGVTFGFSAMKKTIVPDVGLSLHFGGGVSERFLLGINIHAAKYLGRAEGASSWVFGGDFEATAFAWRGLYFRLGLGGQGLPAGDLKNTVTVGIGGNAGIGYEFWLNATAAASVGLTYDLRYVAGPPELVPDPIRHSAMIGMRFSFY